MFKKIAFVLILTLFFPRFVFAQDKASPEDKIVGGTFKTLAKAFVATADIDQLKKSNIARLNKMSEEKFNKRYAEVYKIIKALPEELKVNYGITATMTKEQAIKNTDSLDKNKMYKIIDTIPDAIINEQFKQCLAEEKQKIQKSNVVQEMSGFWNNIMRKFTKAPPAWQ